MKKLITIIALFTCINAAGQTYDTIPSIIPLLDTTSQYYIYNNKGKLVDKVVKVEAWSIPSGGWASRYKFINNQEVFILGYVIWDTDSTGRTMPVKYMDGNKRDIAPPYIISRYNLPVNGYLLKEL